MTGCMCSRAPRASTRSAAGARVRSSSPWRFFVSPAKDEGSGADPFALELVTQAAEVPHCLTLEAVCKVAREREVGLDPKDGGYGRLGDDVREHDL